MAAYAWGGSEELWHRTALAMAGQGVSVEAHYPFLRGWHPKMDELLRAGVQVHGYGLKSPRMNGWASAVRARLSRVGSSSPWPAPGMWKEADLVVVSQGGISDGLGWLETLSGRNIPYAIVVQANAVASWPSDSVAARLRDAFGAAQKVFFVSEDNLRLFRTQVAYTAGNTEVIWNPLNSLTPEIPLPWPEFAGEPLKLAMVGRIEPFAKGQDLALEALASDTLRTLPIHLSIYGNGPWSDTCQRLIDKWNLENVRMMRHSSPSEIWKTHHVLLLPSRHEGTSLAMLEALWLGRPVLATPVAGALSEIVDGENGYFIDSPTAQSMERTILRAWASKSTLAQMGLNAARRIRERMPEDPASVLANSLFNLATSHA